MAKETAPETESTEGGQPTGKRPGRAKVIVAVNVVIAFACIVGGVGLLYANQRLGNRQVVTLDTTAQSTVAAEEWNLPTGDLTAKNYLITGADTNSDCIDPNSPFHGGLGNRTNFGERSDTIMIIRVNPETNQAAILSFPRDLWVKIADSNRKSRINSAFERKNPNKLISTIKNNFDINVDHYINVDFCTFKEVVDAVGGVKVPFLFKVKDKYTGLNVPEPSCFEFNGDHALAYVRSRHYRYFDTAKNKWITDGLSDWGRISRQQDFTKRMAQKALDRGKSSPTVANQILDAALKNVITDDQLTPIRLLQLAQAMRTFDPNTMGQYTMRAVGAKVGENSVLLPDFEDDNMKKILAVFRGQATLAQRVVTDTSSATATTVEGASFNFDVPTSETLSLVTFVSAIASGATTTTVATVVTAPPTTTTTLPVVDPVDNRRGIVPPDDPSCR